MSMVSIVLGEGRTVEQKHDLVEAVIEVIPPTTSPIQMPYTSSFTMNPHPTLGAIYDKF